MSRFTLPSLATLAITLIPHAGAAQPLTVLKAPPNVDLPFGDLAFPDGPGSDAISNNCLTCHSADHVMNQPSLTKTGWEEVVAKMVRAYKAPISKEDQNTIADYLTRIKGIK